MPRSSKLFLALALIAFALACNAVTQPISDAQEAVSTVQSAVTQVSEFTTAIPLETLSALPTQFSQVGDYFNPQGAPVAEWNGIPIMPQATAGQEFDANNYSFKYTGSPKEASEFYSDTLGPAGWSPMVTSSDDQGGLLIYSKDSAFLTITITTVDGGVVVWMSLS
jgi:hypothetical protein